MSFYTNRGNPEEDGWIYAGDQIPPENTPINVLDSKHMTVEINVTYRDGKIFDCTEKEIDWTFDCWQFESTEE